MAPLDDAELRRICGKRETASSARELLRLAKARTGPGSGRDLGPRSIALPAICAHIASRRLQNDDVSEKVAQVASCLDPKSFSSTLKVVLAVLDTNSSPSKATHGKLTYGRLIHDFGIRMEDKMISWMEQVERTLIDGDPKWENRVEVTCVVFYWTCCLLDIDRVDQATLQQEHGIVHKKFGAILRSLNLTCESVATKIKEELVQINAQKRALRSAPSINSPSKSALRSVTHSPSAIAESKRKVAFTPQQGDIEEEMPETPTKKRKIDTRARPVTLTAVGLVLTSEGAASSDAQNKPDTPSQPHEAGPSTPRRLRQYSAKRTAHPDEEEIPMDVDTESDLDELLMPNRRRFRPIFLDRKQWYQRDPRIEREWKTAETHKRGMVGLYGHPFDGWDISSELQGTMGA